MPELPDLAAMKRYVDATALHQQITGVEVHDSRILGSASARQLQSRLRGARFERSRRHGKHLFIAVNDRGWLALHFGMSGFLQYYRRPANPPAHERVRFGFESGFSLAYGCQRMLGRVDWTADVDAFLAEAGVGPDALADDFDLKAFERALGDSRAAIKAVLMDQKRMAGIGNVYADEICFQARVHPAMAANRLDADTVSRLYVVLRRVLESAVSVNARLEELPAKYLIPHREKGGRCPECGTPLEVVSVSGRTCYLCPACQHAPTQRK